MEFRRLAETIINKIKRQMYTKTMFKRMSDVEVADVLIEQAIHLGNLMINDRPSALEFQKKLRERANKYEV